jgi:hypothetical protein
MKGRMFNKDGKPRKCTHVPPELVHLALPLRPEHHRAVHQLQGARALLHQGPASAPGTPTQSLEISDRASIYGDPRTENKSRRHARRHARAHGCLVRTVLGAHPGQQQGATPNHDNQLPEVYLERVILGLHPSRAISCSTPSSAQRHTGVVARAHDRRFIGTEFSPENARSAVARIKNGPARPLGQSRGKSTAIFEARATLQDKPAPKASKAATKSPAKPKAARTRK